MPPGGGPSNLVATYDPSVPRHHQIQRLLRAQIDLGEWAPGEQIPTELALVKRFSVSRTTIRAALRALERDGLIVRQRGRGSFVHGSTTVTTRPTTITNVLLGYEAEGRIIDIASAPVPASVAPLLGILRGDDVRRFVRVEIVQGSPLAAVFNYMRIGLGNRIQAKDLRRHSMLECLRDKLGIKFGVLKQSIEARMPDEEVATLLNVDLTQPVLFLRLLVLDVDDAPVQVCDTFYRADRYRYEIEAPLPAGGRLESGRLRMLGRLL
jgi:GntR family transcriptional regulator